MKTFIIKLEVEHHQSHKRFIYEYAVTTDKQVGWEARQQLLDTLDLGGVTIIKASYYELTGPVITLVSAQAPDGFVPPYMTIPIPVSKT